MAILPAIGVLELASGEHPMGAGGPTGVPQVSIPGAAVDDLPVGLSIVGGPGSDATLVGVATALTAEG